MLEEQRILEKRELFDRIASIAEKYMTVEIDDHTREDIFRMTDQTKKYEALTQLVRGNLKENYEVRKFDMEFVVGMLYPKIDAHVSAQTNHLLKAPFNVHHDSQKLSVPLIDVKNFDVNNCLTISDLCGERKSPDNIKGRSKYSLGDYFRFFEQFCKKLEEKEQMNEMQIEQIGS